MTRFFGCNPTLVSNTSPMAAGSGDQYFILANTFSQKRRTILLTFPKG